MKRCNYCKEVIQDGATVCKHCVRPQNKIKYLFNSSANILTLAFLIVAIFQYNDSRIERNKAIKAETDANIALAKASIAQLRADSLNRKLNLTISLLNKTTLLNTQNGWILANNSMLAIGRSLAVVTFEKNSNSLIRIIIPDSIKRERWWKETQNLVPR